MTINPLFVAAKAVWVSFFLLSFTVLYAQNQTMHAVLAGSEYTPNTESGGMERKDHVYYFRPDASFCSELDKADWQKKVTGTYSIDGNRLKMKWMSDGAEKVILLGVTGTTGQMGAATFIKMEVAGKVPPGLYKYTRSSGRQEELYFDPSGRFGRLRFTQGTPASSKGKKSKPYNGDGFYTLAQSVLTLQYDNGRTSTQSFFVSEDKITIAVIDGRIFYREEENNVAQQAPDTPSTASTETANAETEPGPAADPSTAMIILQSANRAHGGAFLDNINTMKAVMNTNNLTITMQADFQQHFLRMESAVNNNTILVEQLEGSTGWSYDGSGYTSLSPQRIREMQHTLYCGQLGLRSDVLAKSTATLQKQQSGLSSVMVQIDNLRAGYIINNQNNHLEALILAGDNNATSSITYSDYKKVDNILLPFTETIQSGNHTQKIVYDKYTINPKLSKEDWAKP
jgi:hypothetical protein